MDRHRAMDKLYKFEKYLSANLDLSNSNEAEAGEGFSDDVCHDFRCRSMSSPAEVAAYRLVRICFTRPLFMNVSSYFPYCYITSPGLEIGHLKVDFKLNKSQAKNVQKLKQMTPFLG